MAFNIDPSFYQISQEAQTAALSGFSADEVALIQKLGVTVGGISPTSQALIVPSTMQQYNEYGQKVNGTSNGITTLGLGSALAGAAGAFDWSDLLSLLAGLLGGGGLGGLFGGNQLPEDVLNQPGILDNLKRLLGDILPGVQESLGQLPESIKPYALQHRGAVKTWSTGTARFWLFTDGFVATIRGNGVVKCWRPPHHIVVSRNPRIGNLVRAYKRTNKLMAQIRKRKSVRSA